MSKKTDREKLDFIYDMENARAIGGIVALVLFIVMYACFVK